MIKPDDTDVTERGEEGYVVRPLHQETFPQVSRLIIRPHDVEHEKRDGNREDAVTERFESVGIRQAHVFRGSHAADRSAAAVFRRDLCRGLPLLRHRPFVIVGNRVRQKG
jgi:hypothetical protein